MAYRELTIMVTLFTILTMRTYIFRNQKNKIRFVKCIFDRWEVSLLQEAWLTTPDCRALLDSRSLVKDDVLDFLDSSIKPSYEFTPLWFEKGFKAWVRKHLTEDNELSFKDPFQLRMHEQAASRAISFVGSTIKVRKLMVAMNTEDAYLKWRLCDGLNVIPGIEIINRDTTDIQAAGYSRSGFDVPPVYMSAK